MWRGRRTLFPEMNLAMDDQHRATLLIRRYSAAPEYADRSNPLIAPKEVQKGPLSAHLRPTHLVIE
jgi:hypothetical protein